MLPLLTFNKVCGLFYLKKKRDRSQLLAVGELFILVDGGEGYIGTKNENIL